MVAHLQHIHLQIFPGVQQIPLGIGLHVAGEKEAGAAVVYSQYQGSVVGVGIAFHGTQHGDAGTTQGEGISRGGNGDGDILLIRIVDEVVKTLGTVCTGGGIHRLGGEHCQGGGQAAHMVFVGVAAHHCRQLLYPLLLQVADQQRAVLHIAAVDEHIVSVTRQQCAVCLTHIQEMNGQPGAVRGDLGLLCRQQMVDEQQQKQQADKDLKLFHSWFPFR